MVNSPSEQFLEVRFINDEVSVYGNRAGLQRLADLILDLLDDPKKGHVHLEDYELLTDESMIGTIVLLDD